MKTTMTAKSEPALQNIPVRTTLGREIRKIFTAKSHTIVNVDYAALELRILEHYRKQKP